MSDLAFIVDSGAEIPPLVEKELEKSGLELKIIPFHIFFGEEQYLDEVTITRDEFYKKLLQYPLKDITTTQPNEYEFSEVYESLDAHIIVLPVFREYSGTYESAVSAQTDNVTVIDSQTTSAGQGFLVMQGLQSYRQKKSPEEIAQDIREARDRIAISIMLPDPVYITSRVRIPESIASKVQSIFKIKAAFKVKGGKISVQEISRKTNSVLEKMYTSLEEEVGDEPVVACCLHANNKKLLEQVVAQTQKRYNIVSTEYMPDIMTSDICPVLGRYVGPGSVGIVLYKVQ